MIREAIRLATSQAGYKPAWVAAISDLMAIFFVWHRRILHDLDDAFAGVFRSALGTKWDVAANDGELIDDASRHGGDVVKSKAVYEDGMFRAFINCHAMLKPSGRLVVVFANKQPDAWETLVSALIRAGFIVDGSWPIQTEMSNRTCAITSAALASSVWLVCRKRPLAARPGWDTGVLEEMRTNIGRRLRDFWDAGIRSPDFVWAATGPALEAYSKHPVVKRADQPGQILTVSEFLTHVRRMVVDFVVGRVLSSDDAVPMDRLDEPTEEPTSGSKVKLKAWNQRRSRSLGREAPGGRPVPLIDRIHRLMQLWKAGDRHKIDEYLDEHGLRRNELFRRVLQSLIELAKAGSEERSLLESLSNHVGTKGAKKKDAAPLFAEDDENE